MTPRERFVSWMLGQPTDRPPFWLFWSPWGRAWQRWEREGKPAEVRDHRSFASPDPCPHGLPVDFGPCPAFEPVVLAEDADYITHVDKWGIVRRDYKHGESMCEFVRFPVAGRDDWERYRAERLDPANPARLAGAWRECAAQWRAAGIPIQLGGYPDVSIFGGLRWLLGDEECLLAFYTDPELVHDIMTHLTDLFVALMRPVLAEARVDVIHIWEDMCGRQGSLISPAHWREFMAPCYLRIKALADEYGVPLISVDTDGDPRDIVPEMMAAGVNYLFPLEVAAGCDVNEFRQQFPELAVMGGIDKRALAIGPEAIRDELDRIWPAVATRRYIPDLDHLVPDDVSWENYRFYCLELRRRVVGE